MDVRGHATCGRFGTIQSLLRALSGTIFLWTCACLGYRTLGRGCSWLPQPSCPLTIRPESAPQSWGELCCGTGCPLWVGTAPTRVWRVGFASTTHRAAFSHFVFFHSFTNYFQSLSLEITEFVILQCSFRVKKNFEGFLYFQERDGVFAGGLLGLFPSSAAVSAGNSVARKWTWQSCPYCFGAKLNW